MNISTSTPSLPGTPVTSNPTTPTGTQRATDLARRRLFVAVANLLVWFAMLWVCFVVLGDQGWTWVDAILFVCFALGTPWTVLGFWNAALGFWLLHGVPDGPARVSPFASAGDTDEPVRISTAVLMTLRNEDPARAMLRLRTVKASLDATGHGEAFGYYVLSDTSKDDVAAAEEAAVEAWRAEFADPARLVYRRRADNTGFKAGNVRDFCARWGNRHELMLPLDADSLMSGEAIVRLVRIMQAHPKLGILQSLVVGMPSTSAFARIFQFGMRQGMRSYINGFAWWIGDCGPFWGHNALVRIKPFHEECDLPILPGGPPLGGHVLSHDQVEATLMRRAGYEVRVLPVEDGSWEENPPTLLEFSRRDLRWCQGNMQYTKLLGIPGLLPTSRFQLVWAILMFVGVPAWTLAIAVAPFKAFDGEDLAAFPAGLAIALYVAYFAMYLSPKLFGVLDILVSKSGPARYGGAPRFLAGAAVELVFSFLLGAAATLRLTFFMIGLLFGRSVIWSGQARDAHGISWRTAAEGLWPQLVFGLLVVGALAVGAPAAAWYSLPLTAGYLVAIPFAVLTADPRVGAWMTRLRLNGIPEEFDTPKEVAVVRAGAPG